MIHKVFIWVRQIIKRIIKLSKEEINMVTKSPMRQRTRVRSSEFRKHESVCEIRRHGKDVVIVNKSGSLTPISHKHVRELGQNALKSKRSAIIKANGLSRAQVGRIASDLREDSNVEVYIRKTPVRKVGRPQPMSFEILIKDGNTDEKE